jgi:hypothetical protein
MARHADREPDPLPVARSLADLRRYVTQDAYLRYSRGPEHDRGRCSRDYESGLELPGLSVNPLSPEPWWRRPIEDWLARQLCNYVHLMDDADDGRSPWVLRGTVVARGPDNEPIVAEVEPVALVAAEAVEEARRRYAERFDMGEDST